MDAMLTESLMRYYLLSPLRARCPGLGRGIKRNCMALRLRAGGPLGT